VNREPIWHVNSEMVERIAKKKVICFGQYPLVNIQKAIENGPFIVELPIENGDFQ
jgi:hypothetical protein